MLNQLIENHHLVTALWSAVNTSAGSLKNVAPLVNRVLKTDAWRKREVQQLGRIVEFDKFQDFITKAPLEGCGWPLDKVEALIKDDAETLAMWRDAVTAEAHRPVVVTTDNVSTSTTDGHGNSRSYTLSRLKRERPDLFERVVSKELSANAAAKEAGFRKSQSSISKLISAWRNATEEERLEFEEYIANWRRSNVN